MRLQVLTPDQVVFEGEVASVKVPGTEGEFQVLNNHAPIVSSLDAGQVTIRPTTGAEIHFDIRSGFIEVLNNQIALLVQGVKFS